MCAQRLVCMLLLLHLAAPAAARYGPAKGCDGALNAFCETSCKVPCDGNAPKLARLSRGHHSNGRTDQWRCYCDYTLSADQSAYDPDEAARHVLPSDDEDGPAELDDEADAAAPGDADLEQEEADAAEPDAAPAPVLL